MDALQPLGLFVAIFDVRRDNPGIMDVVYYHDSRVGDTTPRQLSLRSDGSDITFPGTYSLIPVGTDETALEIEVTRASEAGLHVTIRRSGRRIATGLAMTDSDDLHSLLISGWTEDTEPYGIARYRIQDDRTIVGHYLSRMSPDHPGTDTAIGDTTNGFSGNYSLTTVEKSGRTWGPHDWQLSRRGDLIDLVWREEGAVICRGLGIVDPRDPRSIIVNYIPVDE